MRRGPRPEVDGMSREMTLAELAGEAAQETATDAATEAAAETAQEAGESSLKWGLELYEKMQSDGTLELLLFGPENVEKPEMAPETPTPESNEMDPTEALNAETIGNVCELVIDKVGDKRLSEVQEACEQRPATINSVIEMYGDELVADPDAEEAGGFETADEIAEE